MKKLGVIGGMGPAATALFMQMVTENTPAERDQDHVPMVILNHVDMPDRTASVLGYPGADSKEHVLQLLTDDAAYLKAGGCGAIAIPCNTCHYFADDLEKASGLHIINMVRLAAAEAAKQADKPLVAVLATQGTINTGLYQDALIACGAKPWNPPQPVQDKVTSLIYDKVKAGKTAAPEDWQPIAEAVRSAGCSCAVIGCTELSVVKRTLNLDAFYLDAMEVLAKACVTWSRGE